MTTALGHWCRSLEESPDNGVASQTREATDVMGQSVLAAVGDVDLDIEDTVAADDNVAVRATVRGTHQGSLLDLAPTGESVGIAYVWFFRVEDGQIAEV